jgi:hypothetical protein
MKSEGFNESQYDLVKASEAKAARESLFQTKANEVVHTGNVGFGAELIQGAVTTTDFLDMAPDAEPGLSFFQGFQGRNMDLTSVVPTIGELGLHDLEAEWTDTGVNGSMAALGVPSGKLPTNKVTINQKQHLFSVDVSDAEVRFNLIDLATKLQKSLATSSARTMLSAILNGDTVATTANINTSGATPGAKNHFLGGNGLRKAAIAAGVQSIGTLTFDKLIGTTFPLGVNNAVPEDVALFMDRGSYNKSLVLTEFKDNSVNGKASTIIRGAVNNVAGADVFINRYIPKSLATGLVDGVTPANNAFGSILAVHKNAVQYGFNGEYQIEVLRIPGKGWRFLGFYYMGFAIADSLSGMPSDANRMVSMGANVTIV